MLTKIRVRLLQWKIERLERYADRHSFVRPVIVELIEDVHREIFRLEHLPAWSGTRKAVVVMVMFALLGVIATMVMNQLVGP